MIKQLAYIEVPTPDTAAVVDYLHRWPQNFAAMVTVSSGIRLQWAQGQELAIVVWSLQRTTYLKIFQWGDSAIPNYNQVEQQLRQDLGTAFPLTYPAPPQIDLNKQNIFEALEPYYPKTVSYFKQFPQGEYDLNRAYWWEQRWRESVHNPQQPKQVIIPAPNQALDEVEYDLVYLGGALGSIHAAAMAQLGYKVLLIERLPFGRMNREWNISRSEFQSLIKLGLFTAEEFEDLILKEYKDGFNKFFDSNNPPHLKANVLHTPTVLNIAIDSEQLLKSCGDKLLAAGGTIWDETEFITAEVGDAGAKLNCVGLGDQSLKTVTCRLIIDAMGTASPIAWQMNGGRTFDSVCPTVGAVVKGIPQEVWDNSYGDVLNSHGDISRGRQLIWELFPGKDDELTFYLFHYHEVHPDNPGSLLEMYEDFFHILPEYRRCNLDDLTLVKPTFGYIPGHFTTSSDERIVAFDRVLAIGDAASLQSPLVFTGFGSLVRNLNRLTDLLKTALDHDLVTKDHLNQIRAYQSNISVTWLFSKGMMVPTHKLLPPERINAMLNTFFGLLADSPPEVADTFIKDRTSWPMFNRLALKAARMNIALLWWIWEMAGTADMVRWLGIYFTFTIDAIISFFLVGWLPNTIKNNQSWLEAKYPALWLRLLSFNYRLTAGLGKT